MKAFHPWLIAAFPVLALYSANFEQAVPGDVLPVLAAALALAAVLLWGARLSFRNPDRAALATSFVVALTLTYGYQKLGVAELAGIDAVPVRTRYLLAALVAGGTLGLAAWGTGRMGDRAFRRLSSGLFLLLVLLVAVRLRFLYGWLLFAGGALAWLHAAKWDDAPITRILNPASLALALMPLGVIAVTWITDPPRTVAADASAGPEWGDALALEAPRTPRDIYLLVFDRYAGQETLLEHFRFDNRPFYDSLVRLGFQVADESHANYPKTNMSMAATLNMEYLRGDSLRSFGDYERLRAGHLVGRLLERMGYRYYYMGNWAMLRDEMADVTHRVSALPSEFARLAYGLTPLADAVSHSSLSGKGDPNVTLRKVETLKRWPAEAGPKFVYAHFLLPHPPYRFNSDGGPADPALPPDSQYVEQLQFTNAKILEMVHAILAGSEHTPILILMADEGPRLSLEDRGHSLPDQIEERTGILSAVLLPGRGSDAFVPETLSPVNVFRLIFREYFGADLDLLADRVFYFERPTWDGGPDWGERGRLLDVTDQVDDPGSEEDGGELHGVDP